MRIAVSNIAWQSDEDDAVLEVLNDERVDAIEIAPTRLFPDPVSVGRREAERAAAELADRGVETVAFQSVLFGREDLTMFGSDASRAGLRHHLERMIDLAGYMGARRLVFGSPRNRIVPDTMGRSEALDVAGQLFRALGARATAVGTVFCIEPNPEVYECNFITTGEQGADLVDAIDSAGFGLHLDAAGMTLSGENPSTTITAAGERLRHFHASAPHLGELEDRVVDHDAASRGLRAASYTGVVSIEMRPGEPGGNAERVRSAIRLARRYYTEG